MTDEAEAEPAVELGDGAPIEGAPVARVASRLTWGIERSEVRRKEGDTVIRTPDGPQTLADVLAEVDASYFESRQAFREAIAAAVGTGPVPVDGEE
jgi:hypothetical protein